MFNLPRTATAPFCPSEVKGSITIPLGLPLHKKMLRYAGPGLLVSVGYMDPGNWATDIEAGSRFGYGLLFVVLLANKDLWEARNKRAFLMTPRECDPARARPDHFCRQRCRCYG